jgi:hypothetical protein
MSVRKILIAASCLVGGIGGGTLAVSRGAATNPVYLDAIIGPAVMRADRVIRDRPALNATSVQIDALNARQGAALQRLKGLLLGKRLIAVFKVTDVADDTRNGGFDVDGNIKLDQMLFYNRAARGYIAAISKQYNVMINGIGRADSGLARQKADDAIGAEKWRSEHLRDIATGAAPAAQQVIIHTINPAVLSWTPGQSRLVVGSVTNVDEYIVRYTLYGRDGSEHRRYRFRFDPNNSSITNLGGSYAQQMWERGHRGLATTNNGGDYIACVVHMDWVASRAPRSAGRVPDKRKPLLTKFTIVMKNGSVVHATSCKKDGDSYDVTEYGMQIEVPVANVVSVTESASARRK